MTDSERMVFYICAHPDDWILFGGAPAFRNLGLANTVIIVATAGDAQRPDAWWQVRERAALAALQEGLGAAPILRETVSIQGELPHSVQVYRSTENGKRSALYCLRLFNRAQPLRAPGMWELYHGTCAAGTVDNSTVYRSWEDFCLILKNIVESESAGAGMPAHIHTHLYRSDEQVNPGDHSEHTLTGLAVRSFAQSYSRSWWWGYEVMKHHHEAGWQITDLSLLSDKWRLWNAYKQAIQKEVARGAALSAESRQAATTSYLDTEWEYWGDVSHTDERWPGQEDP